MRTMQSNNRRLSVLFFITTEAIACNRNTPGETVRQSRAGSDCMGEQPGRLGEQQALACDQPGFHYFLVIIEEETSSFFIKPPVV